MGMHYVDQCCFIAAKEAMTDSGEALVLSPDYTLRRVGISKDFDNWYPIRAEGTTYIYPNQRRMSLRLATTMSRIRMPKPTYSARIMNVSDGLRRVIIS